MKKDSFYKVIIICLLLLNVSMLAFLWYGKKEYHAHNSGPDRMIIERLKLNEKQQQIFEGLKHEHHSQMVEIQQEGGKLHDVLFSLLQKQPEDTAAENTLLLQIQQNELRKEQVTLEHFRKLRAMLRPEQQPLFDSFISELSRQLMGPPPHGGPPHDEPQQDGPPNDGPPPGRP